MGTISDNRWLTVIEAAKHIKSSRNLLDKDRSSRLHGIPFYRLGRHVRYLASDLDDWLKSSKSTLAEEVRYE